MKPRKKTIAIFVIVHIFLITAFSIHFTYLLYPREVGMAHWRSELLQEIYDELKAYKEETGAYPTSLDSLLWFDSEKGKLFFRSKQLKGYSLIYYSHEDDEYEVNQYLNYTLINGEPVLTDLGKDREKGGMAEDFDVTYPSRYQMSLSYLNFMQTEPFYKSVVYGLVFASVMSLCLYKIWKNRLIHGTWSVLAAIFVSIIFLVFELHLAVFVLFAHIYPHH